MVPKDSDLDLSDFSGFGDSGSDSIGRVHVVHTSLPIERFGQK